MQERDKYIYYNGQRYLIISSTNYLNRENLFVINEDDNNIVKVILCSDRYEEVEDLDLIKEIINQMN